MNFQKTALKNIDNEKSYQLLLLVQNKKSLYFKKKITQFIAYLNLYKHLICLPTLLNWSWSHSDSTKVTLKMWTDLIAIKDVGQFICSQFGIRADIRTGPAHSHLPRGHRLKLKVPLSLGDSVRLLCPEDSYLVTTDVLKAMASCRLIGKR